MQICGSVRKTHRYLFYRKQVFTVVTGHLPDYMHNAHDNDYAEIDSKFGRPLTVLTLKVQSDKRKYMDVLGQ